MNRPFVLRLLPDRLRMSVWARCYRHQQSRWRSLYASAELTYAPGVRMELVPGDVISDCIAFTGLYELNVTRRIVQLAKAGGVFVDVGANLGYFALLWAAANPANRCFAFEASPKNIDLLRRNVQRNGFQSQIQIFSQAVGNSAGKMRFDLGPADQTGWGGFTGAANEGIEVDVIRVDQVVPANHRIALLKVDIEGADAWALMGCEDLLKSRSIGEIWYEQNKPRIRALGIAENAAQEYLRSVGYAPRPLDDESRDLVEWCATPV